MVEEREEMRPDTISLASDYHDCVYEFDRCTGQKYVSYDIIECTIKRTLHIMSAHFHCQHNSDMSTVDTYNSKLTSLNRCVCTKSKATIPPTGAPRYWDRWPRPGASPPVWRSQPRLRGCLHSCDLPRPPRYATGWPTEHSTTSPLALRCSAAKMRTQSKSIK